MMIILFAGHDTTGHTMTWFTYEMARYPLYQARVQAEVDAMFDGMAREGRTEMTYDGDYCSPPPPFRTTRVPVIALYSNSPARRLSSASTGTRIAPPSRS